MYLVCGATGNIGAELVRALAGDGERVRALVHGDPPADLPDGVEAVRGDLDKPPTLAAAFDGVRGVFLLPGYSDMPGVLREARDAGVGHVVLLSGSSAASGDGSSAASGDGSSAASGDESNAVTAYMMRSEEAVRRAGGSWTIIRSYGFLSNTLRWRPELRDGDVVREPFADVPVAMIDPYDIAAVAAVALRTPGHDGQVYTVSGPESLRPADRLRILGAELGRDLRLDALNRDDARAELDRQMPKPFADAMWSFYADGTLDESQPLATVEQVLGRRPRTCLEWTRQHADDFR